MHIIPTGNIILVHKGALGDFLLCWPSMLSIRTAFPDSSIFWAGRTDFLFWLNPLRICRLPGTLISSISGLYHVHKWPAALEGYKVFWFGINRVTTSCVDHRLIFLTGVDREASTNFRKTCLSILEKNGIFSDNDWKNAWNDFFGPKKSPEYVLLFPGSGNRKKNWPLENYLGLAHLLEKKGFKVKFVLGPVEQEQGVDVQGFDAITCHNYEQLQNLIKKALFVVGNDCGPMHLAGMFNVPGIALFGPTSPEIWGPHGIDIITSPKPCRPCSETAIIDCLDPACMSEIKIEKIMKIMEKRISNRVGFGQ